MDALTAQESVIISHLSRRTAKIAHIKPHNMCVVHHATKRLAAWLAGFTAPQGESDFPCNLFGSDKKSLRGHSVRPSGSRYCLALLQCTWFEDRAVPSSFWGPKCANSKLLSRLGLPGVCSIFVAVLFVLGDLYTALLLS